MRKSLPIYVACVLSLFSLVLTVPACSPQPSASQVQTAVAGTLANAGVQPAETGAVVEVTRVIEVTKILEVRVTSALQPTQKTTATATRQPEEVVEATPTGAAGAASTKESTATAAPIVASGPLGLSLNLFMNNYAELTDLQKQDYRGTLPGKTVSWTAQVSNITPAGTLILDNPYGSGRVFLEGVPLETAIEIDAGMLVDFTGMIKNIRGTYFIEIYVVEAKVIRFYPPPTGTLTSHR
jgi:hypothetical protein